MPFELEKVGNSAINTVKRNPLMLAGVVGGIALLVWFINRNGGYTVSSDTGTMEQAATTTETSGGSDSGGLTNEELTKIMAAFEDDMVNRMVDNTEINQKNMQTLANAITSLIAGINTGYATGSQGQSAGSVMSGSGVYPTITQAGDGVIAANTPSGLVGGSALVSIGNGMYSPAWDLNPNSRQGPTYDAQGNPLYVERSNYATQAEYLAAWNDMWGPQAQAARAAGQTVYAKDGKVITDLGTAKAQQPVKANSQAPTPQAEQPAAAPANTGLDTAGMAGSFSGSFGGGFGVE